MSRLLACGFALMTGSWLGSDLAGATEPLSPAIVAHRGGALLWPENSLMAFRGALDLGVDFVELDVHLTKDGELVVIHDATLERTTTGHGAVGDHTWAEIAKLTLRESPRERVPRLREVLALIRPSSAGALVEIKAPIGPRRYPGIEAKMLALLSDMGFLDRTTVMAFEWDTLERFRALSSTVRLSGLLGQRGADRVGGVRPATARLRQLGANDLGIKWTLLAPETVAAARAAGLTIGVWTVNEPDFLRDVVRSGVDYVTTDRPDVALELRNRR